MTNAHTVAIAAIVMSFVIAPWWQGFAIGAAFGVLACLITDVVEGFIRAIFGGSHE